VALEYAASALICNFDAYDEEEIEGDCRGDPENIPVPNHGVILKVVDGEGAEDEVHIEMYRREGNGGSMGASQDTCSESSVKYQYILRMEEDWSSWGKCGTNHKSCEKIFSSVQDAIYYAPNLICNFEEYCYGEVLEDYRENPDDAPENGEILEVEDEEGTISRVIMERAE